MKIHEHVDALFTEYNDSPSMQEFKEELIGNLTDRITALCKKGMNESEAQKKALAELGDISVIADALSLKKKQEVYSEMYMGTRTYLTTKRTILFILGGAIICFGLLVAAMTWYATEMKVAALASGMVFVTLGTGFLTYMVLTQETAYKNPMHWNRAIFYAISVAVFIFGIATMPLVYFATTEVDRTELVDNGWMFSPENLGFTSAIGVMLMLVIPSIALFIFLYLTEKERSKPWVVDLMEKRRERFANAIEAERFGLFSGALWISAITAFVLLTIIIGIKFSWSVFAAAVVGQMLLTAGFSKSMAIKEIDKN